MLVYFNGNEKGEKMKLQLRLKKIIALTAVAGTLGSSVAVFASDYQNHWAEPVINEWKNKGIIDGYEDGSFKPKQAVTRAELAKMLVEVFKLTAVEGADTFKDIPEGAWYTDYVSIVSAAGLMAGTEGNFRPTEVATREEAAYAVATAYQITGETEHVFKDHAGISEWAAPAVEALVAGGYIDGYPDGTFKPQGTLTRAEMVTLLDKITAEIIREAGVHTQDIAGNLVVSAKGATLKDMTIHGNLYLSGSETIILDNVTVTGKIYIQGQALESVQIKGKSQIKDIVVDKPGNQTTKVNVAGTTTITGTVKVESPTVIEGTAVTLPKVVVDGAKTVEIKGTVTVKEVDVQTQATVTLTGNKVEVGNVVIDKNAESTAIKGNGKVDNLHSDANKVVIDQNITIDKDNISAGQQVTVPPVIQKPSTEDSGSVTTPVLKLEEAYIQLTDGSTIKVPLHQGSLHVDATGSQILINDVAFSQAMQIESAGASATNVKEVRVSVIPGTLDDVTLQPNRTYTIADLADIVAAKREDAYGIIQMFEDQGALTGSQADRARDYLTQALDIFAQSAGDDYVSVASIQHYIGRIKAKIQSVGVDRINSELADVLHIANVKITEDQGIIQVRFRLDLLGNNDATKSINVQLKF